MDINKFIRSCWHNNKIRYALILAFSALLAAVFGFQYLKYRGVKPSRKSRKDFRMACAVAPLPESFSLPLPIIKNQQAVSSCCAHSMSYVSERVLNIDKASVGWIYGYRPTGYFQGEGMYPREALKTINQLGVVPYDDFPFNEEVPGVIQHVNSEILNLKPKAAPHKSATFFALKSTDEIKTCILKYGPVSIMYPVCQNFEDAVNGKIEKMGKDFIGYHQVTLFGWKPGYWLMVNSWGPTWANAGTAWVSFDYPWQEAWGFSTDPNAGFNPPRKWWDIFGLA